MKPKYTLLSVFLAFCLVFGLCAEASAYTLSLETTSDGTTQKTQFNTGEYIYVNIVLDNRQGVAGCAFTLTYPSVVLEAPAIDAEGLPTNASDIVSAFPFTFTKDGVTTKTHRVNGQTAGSLFLSGTEINMTTGGAKYETAGRVVLFTVRFRVKTGATLGGYSFSLSQTQLHNPDAGYGTVTDVNSKAPVPILVGAVDKNHASWNNLSEAFPILLATMTPISKDFNIANTTNGSVIINAEPAAMNTAAPWTLAGPNSFSQTGTGDQTLTSLAPGDYTLTWVDVSGWTKPSPASSTQTLAAGGTVTFTGTYMQTGTVVINPEPNSINAPWTLAGPNSFSQTGTGDQTLTSLAPGDYTLAWVDVSGWTKPSPTSSTQTLAAGGTVTFTGTYMPTGSPQIQWASPIPDTGQTKCYNNTIEITCPTQGQPFYGQDGNYTINPLSYTKLDADGATLPDSAATWAMVRDNVTGLIWENKTDDGGIHDKDNTYTWCDTNPVTNGGNQGTCGTGTGNAATDTEAFIKALNDAHYGGFSDWRMPTAKELPSIVDFSLQNPAIYATFFPGTVSFYYWSSNTFANNNNAWCVSFYNGHVANNNKAYASVAVRAVRGGQSESLDHLVINGDGTVTDTATGLMWQQGTSPSALTWEAALTYAEGLSLAGYDDWRVPTVKELPSIVDYIRINPAIDTTFFPGTVSPVYWSSTTNASGNDNAWCVDFSSGYVGNNLKSSANAERTVRGGQPRLLGHLIISSPGQADKWNIGEQMTIAWDTAGIGGNVKITLSRQGGKAGTFETIIASTENDGSFDWTVAGPASVNCVLKIEPLNDPSKATSQGLFSIISSPVGTVVIDPEPAAMNTTAPWTLTGPNSYNRAGTGDQTLPNLPIGDYSLTWGDVVGWNKPLPAAETKALISGGMTTFSGTYVQHTGSLTVTITPQGARDAGGQWRRVGTTPWFNSGSTENGIPVGSYTVEFKDVTGWTKPSSVAVTISNSQTTTASGTYIQQTGTVVINPDPNGINAPWTLTGPNNYSRSGIGDTTLIDLDSGSYTLTWGDVAGWSKPSPAASTQTLPSGGTITFTGTYATEAVSVPAITGPTSGKPGQTYSYTASGSTSSLGHAVEYQFDWKGDETDLSAWGAATQSKTWPQSENYCVRVRARCTTHPAIVSAWSSCLTVAINASTAVRNMPGYYGPGYPILVQITMTPDTGVNVYAVEDIPPAGWTVSDINETGGWDAVNKKVKWGPYFDHNVRTLTYKATPPISETGKKTFAGSGSFDGVTVPIGGASEVDKGTFHPADTTHDYRIAISECTSYGFAWKTGATWSVEPNPIPIGYMTNACYLWKIGEVYHFDPNTTPPYVTGEATSRASGHGANSSVKNADKSGDRRSSAATTVGKSASTSQSRRLLTGSGRGSNNTGWYDIKVEVTPVKGVQGYAVEETLPGGTEVQGINNSGNWDRTNGKVKWGPFLDNMPRIFQYQIRDTGAFSSVVSSSGFSSASLTGSRTNAGRVSKPTATLPPSLFAIRGVASFDGTDALTVNTGSLASGAGDDKNAASLIPATWMDFDGDGRSDLTELEEGTLKVALMSGEQELEAGRYTLSSSQKILGYGDWDGDGRADILLGDDSGNIRAWLMEGTKVREERMIRLPAGAKSLGIGDVNGDGIADLLWRDAQGAIHAEVSVSAESLNAADGADALSISRSSIILGWMDSRTEVLSLGDYDGNGNTDILWRDGNGALQISLMERTGLSTIQIPMIAPTMMPIGSGDMNGDGTADILWRDASGSLTVWLMNGPNQPKLIQIGQPTPGWEVIGVGDYDGNGIVETLWTYRPTGERRITIIDALTGGVN